MKTLYISGFIGEDVTPADFREQLKDAAGESLLIVINSPGGYVFDGREIYREIENYAGKVEVQILLAASMASVMAMAADVISVGPDAVMMIHRASGISIGNAKDHAAESVLLERLDNQLAETYSRRTGKSVEEILNLMDETTYFFGKEIVDAGFGDIYIGGESGTTKEAAVNSAAVLFNESYSKPDFSQVAACIGLISRPDGIRDQAKAILAADPYKRKAI